MNENGRFQFSWSHFVLAVVSIVFLLIVGFSISIVIYCFDNELYEYGVQVLIGLFSMSGAIITISISYYEWKSKNENQTKINNAKYDKRLDLAMKICDNLKEGKIDIQSVAVLKELISDGQTNVSVNGYNGTVTTVEDVRFDTNINSSYSEQYGVDDILDEVNFKRTDGMG